jgi:hypothetical protein
MKRKLILGVIVLVVSVGIGAVGAGLLIGQAAGRDVSRELGDLIARDFGRSISRALWK